MKNQRKKINETADDIMKIKNRKIRSTKIHCFDQFKIVITVTQVSFQEFFKIKLKIIHNKNVIKVIASSDIDYKSVTTRLNL